MGAQMPFRLSGLPAAVRVTLTAFVVLVGAGYLAALANIYQRHRDADLEPGLSLDDLRRVYHGLERPAPSSPAASPMLREVRPDGSMRKHLDKGGEPAVRALVGWLEAGAKEADFARAAAPGDPSPRDVLARQCIRCHNAATGKKKDVPYAAGETADPTYALVSVVAAPPAPAPAGTVRLPPIAIGDLVQSTHVHMISIPVFALLVGVLFFLTGAGPRTKAVLGPLPMLAAAADVGSWWLARPIEPFIYVIGAAGAVFGISLALQIAGILRELWLIKPGEGGAAGRGDLAAAAGSRSA